jgi:hypothetical protein
MNVSYRLKKNGSKNVLGPYTHEQVVDALSIGEFNQYDSISVEGGEWEPLRLCDDFFDTREPSRNTTVFLTVMPFTGFLGMQFIYLKNYWMFAAQLLLTTQCIAFWNPLFFAGRPILDNFNIFAELSASTLTQMECNFADIPKVLKVIGAGLTLLNLLGLVSQFFTFVGTSNFGEKYSTSKEKFAVVSDDYQDDLEEVPA